MLTPYLPYPPVSGGQTRSYNLLKKLSENHQITLFSLIKEEKEKEMVEELKKFCNKVFVFKRSKTPFTLNNILQTGFGLYPFLVIRNLVPEEKESLEKELKDHSYDLIHAETFYVMPHIPKTKIPILLVDQTIEYLVYKHYVKVQAPLITKPFFSIDVAKLKYWETRFWKIADRVVAMSESDKNEMQRLVPNLNVDIVPNGIDINYFENYKTKKLKEPRVLYVGNFKWLQNVEAAEVLINKVWPLIKKKIANAKLWIVGRYITDSIQKSASSDIEITENIGDIREAYSKSSVLVAPIEGPGGTRLKILESMAASLPVVSTPVGVEGLDIKNGVHAFVSDTWKGLADYAVEVIKNDKVAKSLGENAKEFVRNKYSWDVSAKILDGLYKEVVNAKGR